MGDILDVRGQDMFIGEIRTQGAILSRADGDPMIIESATYQRYIGEVPLDPSPLTALVDQARVYANIEAGVEEGYFHILFTCIVGIQVIKVRVRYAVVGYNH